MRRSVAAWLCAALAALAAAPSTAAAQASAAPLPAGLERVTSVEGITEYRLPNGLQVLLVPDDSKPTTTVNMTYRVGSRQENYGETGMAHLLEHLMFKGTPTTRNVLAETQRRGMRPNGTTWYDRTNYFASFAVNDDNLRWYLSWQADAMTHSLIARSDLDTEMSVVRNEFERGENNPLRVLLQQTMATMYQWHNYGKSTIGARSDIENVDIPRLQAFYRQYYQPDNATLTISGQFNAARTLAWVAEFFGPIPKPTRVLPKLYTLDPPQNGERDVTVRRSGGTPIIDMGFHVPAGPDPDFASVELLTQVLGDTPSGRLHKRLVETQLASGSGAFAFPLAEPSPLFLTVSLAPGQDVAKARVEMQRTVASLRSEPISAEEFNRARTAWLNGWERGFNDPERIGIALSEAIGMGDWRLFFLRRDQVRALKREDVQRVADTWLRRDNVTVGEYLPTTTPERAPQARAVDLAAMLKDYRGDANAGSAEAFDPTPANLDARTQLGVLDSGLKWALLPKGTRGQQVRAKLRLRLGSGESLFGQSTVSAFAAELIDKGGAGLTRQQVADRFEALQAAVNFSGGDQVVDVDITTRRERLPDVLLLVGRLLREPEYAAAPLEELRRQGLSAVETQRKEPGAITGNLLARNGNPYPRGDLRYAGTFDENEQDLRAVTLEQVRRFHRRFYSAAHGEFAAVGDFDAAAVRQALQQAFGNWRTPADGALAYVRLPQPLVQAPAQRFVVQTPDKANAEFRARLGLPLNDRNADYPALLLANMIFGASSDSRLWMRVRERDGLSYDVRSSFDWARIDDNTPWNASASFAPQNQPRLEAAFNEELARSLKDGFTAAELERVRNAFLSARRLQRAQDGFVATELANNLFLDRRFAFAQRLDEAVAGTPLEQVNAAWRRYLNPAALAAAWGGDFGDVLAKPR